MFWAVRGGGAGSWGVIVSATFRAYPTFNATYSNILVHIENASTADIGSVMSTHAAHISDLDSYRSGQYFWITIKSTNAYDLSLRSWLPTVDEDTAKDAMQPVSEELKGLGLNISVPTETYSNQLINDLLYTKDNTYIPVIYMGSRLIPEEAYGKPENIGKMYEQLFDAGSQG